MKKTNVAPKGYEFPPVKPGESTEEYLIRTNVHPSCKNRMELHPEDVIDKTIERMGKGYVITPPARDPKKEAMIRRLMKELKVSREVAEAMYAQ